MKHIDPNTLFFGNYVDADIRLSDLYDFLLNVEKYLNKKKSQIDKKPKGLLGNVEYAKFGESFPSILYNSIYVSAWAFMEQEIKGYCRAIQKIMKLDIGLSDINGALIDRFNKYTKSILGLKYGFEGHFIEDMKAMYEIRNCLVHNDGIIPENKMPTVKKYIKRSGIQLILDGRIELEKRALENLIGSCSIFLKEIYRVALIKFPGEYSPVKQAPITHFTGEAGNCPASP
jgi:hypothetical protein